jgi:hypothetical protein
MKLTNSAGRRRTSPTPVGFAGAECDPLERIRGVNGVAGVFARLAAREACWCEKATSRQ